jgi:hypothetical protein
LRKGHKFGVFTPTEPEALIYTLSLAALGVETVLGPTCELCCIPESDIPIFLTFYFFFLRLL